MVIMNRDLSKNSDDMIKKQIEEWVDGMFTGKKGGGANPNTVMLYSPLIQWAQSELTSRYVKRTTWLALCIGGLALLVSLTALLVSI